MLLYALSWNDLQLAEIPMDSSEDLKLLLFFLLYSSSRVYGLFGYGKK